MGEKKINVVSHLSTSLRLEIDVVPRRLRVDVASAFHSAALAFRSAATELRVAAALVGRGGLTGRHLARPEVLAPNAAAGAGQQSSLEVADSDRVGWENGGKIWKSWGREFGEARG